jgi:phosphomannomutase
MTNIKFGTDGWRAIIAEEFTIENLARVAEATARWLIHNCNDPVVVIGHDTRFGGELFAQTTAKILCKRGVKVFLAKGFVSTPMVSLGTVVQKADLGIVITASHNPPSYNGFKLKGAYGGPLLPEKIEQIEELIPENNVHEPDKISLNEYLANGRAEYIDLEKIYIRHVEAHFDLDKIRSSGLNLAYDAMYGAGQNVIKKLLPDATLLHCDNDPSFKGQAPEPIHKNLAEFSRLIKNRKTIDCGLATDGDADRIGLYDADGNFVDANHIMLILIKYLAEKKSAKGKVLTSFSVSPKIKKMCDHYGLTNEVTRIGFKHIAGKMVSENVVVGGEESGGIAIAGHIPERDGIWIGLTIWECMATSGRSLKELIKDVYSIVGSFSFERSDLHLKEEQKNSIVENCKQDKYKQFGTRLVKRTANLDGYKYFFSNDEWILIRASGTEPVLRVYAETESLAKTMELLAVVEKTLLQTNRETQTKEKNEIVENSKGAILQTEPSTVQKGLSINT